jgi:hypothetical protein
VDYGERGRSIMTCQAQSVRYDGFLFNVASAG